MTTNTPTPYYNLTKVQQRILRQALSTYNNEQLKNLILGDGSFVLRESDVIKGLTDELKLSQSHHAKASALVGELKRFLEANGFAVEFENRNKRTPLLDAAAGARDDHTDALLSLFQGNNPVLDGIPYFIDNGAGGFTQGVGSFEDFLQTIFGEDLETTGPSGTVTGRFPSAEFRTIDLGGGRKVDVLNERPVNTAGAFEADRAARLRAVIDDEIAKHPELLDACLAVKLDPEDAEILGRLIGVSPAEAQASLDRVQTTLRAKKAEVDTGTEVDITINGATSKQAEVIRDALTTALQALGLNGRSTLEAPKGKPTKITASKPLPVLSPLQINQCEVLLDEYVDDYRITSDNTADLYLDSDTTFHQFALAAASCTGLGGRLTPINPEHFLSYLVNHRG